MSNINRDTVKKFIKKLEIEVTSYDADILRLKQEIIDIESIKQEKSETILLIKSILEDNSIDVKKLLIEDVEKVQ